MAASALAGAAFYSIDFFPFLYYNKNSASYNKKHRQCGAKGQTMKSYLRILCLLLAIVFCFSACNGGNGGSNEGGNEGDSTPQRTEYNIVFALATIPPVMAALDCIESGRETYAIIERGKTYSGIEAIPYFHNAGFRY